MKRTIDSKDGSMFDDQISLLSEFYSRGEATEIIEIFTNAQHFASHDADELDRSLELFLVAAENRKDLLTELFAEQSYEADSKQYNISRPLFEAIHSGDVALVEVFLRAGASVSLKSPFLPRRNNVEDTWNELVEPVEYACLLDDPEMVSCIVSYERRFYYKRTRGRESALEIVTSLAVKWWKRTARGDFNISKRQFALAKFVQVIIDAGVSVGDIFIYYAVELLLEEVCWLVYQRSITLSSKVLEAVVEAVHVFLKAASDEGIEYGPWIFLRLNIIVFINNARNHRRGSLKEVFEFPLMMDAFRSDLKRVTSLQNLDEMLCTLLDDGVMEVIAKLYQKIRPVCKNVQNEINKLWAGFSELYRTILLFKGRIVYDDNLWNHFQGSSLPIDEFAFLLIMNGASREGGSVPLVRLLLTRMTASQIIALRQSLFSKEPTTYLYYREIFPIGDFARALMFDIETPRSLQHLARVAVVDDMANKRIYDATALGLPKHLEDYVQLK